MALLQGKDLSKVYLGQTIFSGVTFELHSGERVGLVGPNGAGKTTLLRLLVGEERPDEGQIYQPKGISIGYLSQHPPAMGRMTIWACMEETFAHLHEMEAKMRQMEQQMGEDPSDLEGLMARYSQAQAEYEEQGGYGYKARIRGVLTGLGFSPEEWEKHLDQCSGGEQTRAHLGRLLLAQPDLLFLDEPTNHLDIQGVEWLESILNTISSTVLVVSHDRFFLDRTVNRILEMDGGRIQSYKGGYREYTLQREEHRKTLERAYKNQQAIIVKEETRIRESRATEKDKRQAKSREKRLAKLERVELPGEGEKIHLGFDLGGRSGELVVRGEGVSLSYGEHRVFEGLNFTIRWGDRIALLGPNGVGKTSLLRLMTGELPPTLGEIRVGPSVRTAYFDQLQSSLDPGSTPYDVIYEAKKLTQTEIRNHLASFLLRGEDVFRPVATLSGGERSRLALARLTLDPANLLILDEPTNHLDIASIEVLEEALSQYPGTLLLVSHDRYFIDSLVTQIYELQEGGLRIYSGDYREYIETKAQEKAQLAPPAQRVVRPKAKPTEKAAPDPAQLEADIEVAEGRKAQLELILANPSTYQDPSSDPGSLTREYQELSEALEVLYLRWAELTE